MLHVFSRAVTCENEELGMVLVTRLAKRVFVIEFDLLFWKKSELFATVWWRINLLVMLHEPVSINGV